MDTDWTPGGGLLKLPEVAELLRISPRTLRRYIADGTIPPHLVSRTGGRPHGAFRFTRAAVAAIAETIWSPPQSPMEPAPRRTGMMPYTPRRRPS